MWETCAGLAKVLVCMFFWNLPLHGKDKGKTGGKVIRSNLTIAERKAKLPELKARSRCLAVGHWAGDAECRFKSPGIP